MKTDFNTYLNRADHKFRADRLLYKEQIAAAFRAAALAGPDVLALAKARAAVINEGPSDKLLAEVPLALRTDPGLSFSRRSTNCATPTRSARRPTSCWPPHAIPRVSSTATNGGSNVGFSPASSSIKTTRRPPTSCAPNIPRCRTKCGSRPNFTPAGSRFASLTTRRARRRISTPYAKLAETPMSRARAAYWQGRAAEASFADDAEAAARRFYEQAAVHHDNLLRPACARQTRADNAADPLDLQRGEGRGRAKTRSR